MERLIKKYNIPAPRYTSYPTVPFWGNSVNDGWMDSVIKCFNETNNKTGISLYIHLPYCEKLCTYCACTKLITQDHNKEKKYIDSIIKEWNMYLTNFSEKPIIREIHLGGGTPTFFSPENLKILINNIVNNSIVHKDYVFSFEAHPNNTSKEHLQTLYDVGFRRVSFGIQDFDLAVQKTINRIQKFETIQLLTELSREIGYNSINYDLIYGLPKQINESIDLTMDKISLLKPDRIAFYSYAHVPWTQKGQRIFSEKDIPNNEKKRELYEQGKKRLLDLGYRDIGMDHFAFPSDELFKAKEEKRLHRNFMGYNTNQTKLLIGLGISSISDAYYAFSQNSKSEQEYIRNATNCVEKNYMLSSQDLIIKHAILDIACKGVLFLSEEIKDLLPESSFDKLEEMKTEGIITLHNNTLKVTNMGMTFLRNICMVFDIKLINKQNKDSNMFSKSI